MKNSIAKAITASIILLPVFFSSCKKDSINPTANNSTSSSDEISINDQPGVYKTTSGATKLVLQPGDGTGEDAWIEYSPSNPDYATHNSGAADEIRLLAWTDGGIPIYSRTLIKFTELSQIPTTSKVKKATLFLYGLSSSTQLPQGDSYYPGSPYDGYGPNDAYVQKVTSKWDESTLTWNTMPATTVIKESLISPSTLQWNYNASIDVTKFVNDFVEKPSRNFGFMLRFTNEAIYRSMGFYSSETTNAAKRPKLVITYN
jgi:hypothetical protein